jgi:hypothetical protein
MKVPRVVLIVAVVLCLAIVGYFAGTYLALSIAPQPGGPRPSIRIPNPDELATYIMIRTIVSTINTGLSICLLVVYTGIYLRTRAEFTIGLVTLAAVLLLYAVTSNPLLLGLIGFGSHGLFFAMGLPELFTSVAVVVLLYLSLK